MHVVISQWLQSRNSGDIFYSLSSLMLLHDIIMTSYWRHSVFTCLQCLLFSVYVKLGHTAYVQQLNCCIKKCQTSLCPLPKLWPTKSPDLNSVDYEIWAVMQHHIYQRQIHSVDELKRWFIDVWCTLEWSIFDKATDQWWGRLWACVHAKERHFEYSLWTDSVTCLTAASLITTSC